MGIRERIMNSVRVSNGIAVRSIHDDAFVKYGKVLNVDFPQLIDWIDGNTGVPAEGNVYVASVEAMESIGDGAGVLDSFYGGLPFEIGYCNGANSTLNGLEYHKGSEINIAVTDLVLLLGCVDGIIDNTFPSDQVEAFYLRRGDVVELYATCLHFAPCKVSDAGFKAVVILPRGTNEPLTRRPAPVTEEDVLLFAVNKWLLAHPERKPLLEKGAHPGILGDNIAVIYS